MNAGDFTREDLAAELEVTVQTITNWLSRGVSWKGLPLVAAYCKLSTDEYLYEAGLLTKAPKGRNGTIAAAALVENFSALPDFLQAYIENKTANLRRAYDGIPAWLRDKLAPPKDPVQYRQWEREIEGLMLRLGDQKNDGQSL